MPLPSYRVESEVFIAPPLPFRVQPKKIAPEEIKSGPGNPPTFGSFGHADYTVIPTNDGFESVSANNQFKTSKKDGIRNGPIITQIDDYYLGHWIKAATDNPPYKHSVIPKMPDFALIRGHRLGMYFPNSYDTPARLLTSHDIVNAVNPNKRGYYESKIANMDETLRNLWDGSNRYQSEAVAWIDFLEKKGFSIETTKNIGITGLGVQKGDFIAAYYPGEKGYLVAEMNFYDRAKSLISRYGLSHKEAVEAMKRYIFLHEIAHVLGIDGDRKSEKLQGELQAEFYSIMADEYKGTKMERIYRTLAKQGSDYAQQFSLLRKFWENVTKDSYSSERVTLDAMITKFETEARALGKRGDELREYVEGRIVDTYGALLGRPFYRKAEGSKPRSKPSKINKGLEGLIQTLKKEARELSVDESEYISNELARSPIKYIKGGEIEAEDSKYEINQKTYERKIDKSEHNSMKDVRDREAKSDRTEAKEAKETAEAPAEAN